MEFETVAMKNWTEINKNCKKLEELGELGEETTRRYRQVERKWPIFEKHWQFLILSLPNRSIFDKWKNLKKNN